MEKYIYNEQNGMHYELVGDYYLPLLTLPETPPIGVWGRRRKYYLKEHRPVLYNTMLLSGELFQHLAEVNQQANELHDRLIKQMTAQAGINEQLLCGSPHLRLHRNRILSFSESVFTVSLPKS